MNIRDHNNHDLTCFIRYDLQEKSLMKKIGYSYKKYDNKRDLQTKCHTFMFQYSEIYRK